MGALKKLQEAPWPGNIRELDHELRRLVYMCPEDQAIESYLLSDNVLEPTDRIDLDALASDLNMESKVAELEKKLITIALARSKNNRSKAAKSLGISRNGLALKMERLGIDV